MMDTLHEQCAGLDVHKDTVVACVRIAKGRSAQREVKTFGTTTTGLLELHDWLQANGITHVAMEATGVYWKPVWHLLEDSFALVLANASHIKAVPGRKTDMNDATWIADLLAHGLIRASFVPPTPIQELRDLTRARKQLVNERTRHIQRIQKVLEDANLKIDSYITDLLGKSGRAVLNALVEGYTSPEVLISLTTGRLKASRAELLEALRGRVTKHHRFLLKLHLRQIDQIDHAIEELEAQARAAVEPFRHRVKQLTAIPGISETAAYVILAEIGTDMSVFPSAGHLLSWAGMCPRSDESAGKRRSTRLRHGAPWLKATLVQIAWPATRKKDSYFRALFHRLKARRGPKKAIVAVAASILTTVYHLLRDGTVYQDLGPGHFDAMNRDRAAKSLIRRLNALGFNVDVRPAAA
jgi:transposase